MNHIRTMALVLAALGVAGIVVAGFMAVAHSLLSARPAAVASNAAVCSQTGARYSMIIKDDKVIPAHMIAPLCDTLRIVNEDNVVRLIAFGSHEDHQPYDGITEQAVGQGQSVDIVLNQPGAFSFHDHIHDEVAGSFTVTTK